MAKQSSDWVNCGETERLVRAICGSGPNEVEPFRSVLRLAKLGHIGMSAERAESQFSYLESGEKQTVPLNLADPLNHGETRWFLENLIVRYRSNDRNLTGFSCFLTGVFEFGEFSKLDGTDVMSGFCVTGLKFSRADILRHFGNPSGTVAAKSEGNKGGRRQTYDWTGAIIHLIAIADSKDGLHPHDKPDATYIGNLLADWFSANSPDGDHPGSTMLRQMGSRIIAEIDRYNAGK